MEMTPEERQEFDNLKSEIALLKVIVSNNMHNVAISNLSTVIVSLALRNNDTAVFNEYIESLQELAGRIRKEADEILRSIEVRGE